MDFKNQPQGYFSQTFLKFGKTLYLKFQKILTVLARGVTTNSSMNIAYSVLERTHWLLITSHR